MSSNGRRTLRGVGPTPISKDNVATRNTMNINGGSSSGSCGGGSDNNSVQTETNSNRMSSSSSRRRKYGLNGPAKNTATVKVANDDAKR